MKTVALFSLLLASSSALAQSVNLQALEACTLIEKDFNRLLCFDKVMANQPISASEFVAPKQTATQPTSQPALSQEDKFGMSARLIEKKTEQTQMDEIQAVVTQVEKSPLGSRKFTLDNNQKWNQIGSDTFYAKEGDKVEIRRGTLGSFLMKKVGSNRSIRVKRVD
jgi:hypothetical protein